MQDEESRPSAASGGGAGTLASMMGVRRAGGKRRARVSSSSGEAISESQEGKIKLVFFLAAVGITLTVLGVGTEFWVELAPSKSFYSNQTCLAAHYGLWKSCTKTIFVADVDLERESCGPLNLPGGELLKMPLLHSSIKKISESLSQGGFWLCSHYKSHNSHPFFAQACL